LISQNGTFKASISGTKIQPSRYYFSVTHVASNSIIWSANRNAFMSDSDNLSLTINGLSVTNQADHQVLWSTPPLKSEVAAMQLLETGNLVLVDARNVTLWESFEYPTDTIVIGQRIRAGRSLQSAVSDGDMSVGDYQLEVTDGDVLLQWNRMTYWKLSMDAKAYKDSNAEVSFMAMNATGLYLLGSDGSTVVSQVVLNGPSSFRIGKLGSEGRFTISSFINYDWVQELKKPDEIAVFLSFAEKLDCARVELVLVHQDSILK